MTTKETDKTTNEVNNIKERIENWINSITKIIDRLGLTGLYNKLEKKDQCKFLQYLTFAFIHKSVLQIEECRNLLKGRLNLGDFKNGINFDTLMCLGSPVIKILTTNYLYTARRNEDIFKDTLGNQERLNRLFIQSGLDEFVIYTGIPEEFLYGNVLVAVMGAVYLTFGFENAKCVANTVFLIFDKE